MKFFTKSLLAFLTDLYPREARAVAVIASPGGGAPWRWHAHAAQMNLISQATLQGARADEPFERAYPFTALWDAVSTLESTGVKVVTLAQDQHGFQLRWDTGRYQLRAIQAFVPPIQHGAYGPIARYAPRQKPPALAIGDRAMRVLAKDIQTRGATLYQPEEGILVWTSGVYTRSAVLQK